MRRAHTTHDPQGDAKEPAGDGSRCATHWLLTPAMIWRKDAMEGKMRVPGWRQGQGKDQQTRVFQFGMMPMPMPCLDPASSCLALRRRTSADPEPVSQPGPSQDTELRQKTLSSLFV